VGPTTDLQLLNTAPGKVAAHHAQTVMLLGKQGYNTADMPGPHRYVDNTCVTCHLNPDPTSGNVADPDGVLDFLVPIPVVGGTPMADRLHGTDSLRGDLATCAVCHSSQAHAADKLNKLNSEIYSKLVYMGGADSSNPLLPDANLAGGAMATFATANSIDLANNSNPNDSHVKAYKAARWNVDEIVTGIALHNPDFARKLLDDAKSYLGDITPWPTPTPLPASARR
jgi:hypothetical protein